MISLKIYSKDGAVVGDVEIGDALLTGKKGEQAVHDAVVAHLAAVRSGNADTLKKGEVAGSNKKPWRQKGTGRARAGYRQSPVWRGGGVAFGPHTRDFSIDINKKVAKLAFRKALSDKLEAGLVKVIDQIVLPEAKTKAFVGMMKSLGVSAPALFLVASMDRKVAMACRNLPRVEIASAKEVSVYQVMKHKTIVVDKAGMDELKRRLAVKARAGAGKSGAGE